MKSFAKAFGAALLLAWTPADASTTIDFESVATGPQTTPLNIDLASFTTSGSGLVVYDFGKATGNEVCGTVTGRFCDGNVDISFSSPINDLTFLYDDLTNNSPTLAVVLSYFGGGSDAFFLDHSAPSGIVDLSGYNNIVGARISSSTYTVYDNFSFDAAAAVPEPATWAMMLLGFGGVGLALRRRRPRRLANVFA